MRGSDITLWKLISARRQRADDSKLVKASFFEMCMLRRAYLDLFDHRCVPHICLGVDVNNGIVM